MTPSQASHSLFNQEFSFPVVGTPYVESGYENCLEATPGTLLELVREPDNKFDPDAIMVKLFGEKIGYVPAKGYSCSKCWDIIDPHTYTCVNCGKDEHIVKKGLASRLVHLNALSYRYVCAVETVSPGSKSAPITAKLLVIETL